MTGLYHQLRSYVKSDVYPFHMPGHKRQISLLEDPYAIDITEIEGFDNLHHAESVLLAAQERAAQLYGAEETFFLVNGSTCGILAAVSACCRRGQTILMARNCHKAAYHALLLQDLHAKYLYPPTDRSGAFHGAISPDQVRQALDENPEIRTVLITSPTYDGVVSDVKSIAEIVHERGGVLIVDEAHGAHFGMHPYFPKHSLSCGADIVINSLHKTLPSLTQTALLHVQGNRADRERLRRYLGIYQSSSPSYVFMAGMERCILLLAEQGEELFSVFAERLEGLRQSLGSMKCFHLLDGSEEGLGSFDYDRSKVVIATENSRLDGPQLMYLLRERYHLELEMEAPGYVTAITTIADTQEGLERLQTALLELDAEQSRLMGEREADRNKNGNGSDSGIAAGKRCAEREVGSAAVSPAEEVMRVAQAEEAEKEEVPLLESGGQISGEFVYLYPPGIPYLVPGERIPKELPMQLKQWQEQGLQLQGLSDYEGKRIRTAKREETNTEHAQKGSTM